MAARGYRPTSQSWASGSYSGGAALIAVLLLLVGIGIFVVAYMLIVRPPGTLTVVYELDPSLARPESES